MTKQTNNSASSVHIAFRAAPQLRDKLEAAAARERRPLSNLIRSILSDWLRGESRTRRAA
jgi:hypothetical protein